MSRWSPEDSDEGRLPEGMQRVGYDADTQKYSYRDQDGSYWEGAPGARYGVLHRSGSSYQPMAIANEQNIHKADNAAWRYILPFFLLISVVLFALFRFLGSAAGPTPFVCPENSVRYPVKVGDSCWAIANSHGVKVADLMRLNYGMDCSLLKAGREICVPASE
ncbi:LysM-domain-containing protein [Hyaloscypha finlandica]|nr:LysM-domain-containing protein [Hyaloscypha finlandica]